MPYQPTHVAHRSSSGLAPEMTAAAFASAIAHRPDHIEIDVQLSSDGVLVLTHDSSLNRTTDVATVFPGREHDPVNTFTFAELRALDIGRKYHPDFAGQRVTAFGEVVDLVLGHDVGVFIELKWPNLNPGLEQAVCDAIEQDRRWAELIDRGLVRFISFDREALQRVVKLRPDIPAMWLASRVPDDETLAEVAAWSDAFGTNYRHLGADTLDRIRGHGFDVALWTMNAPAVLRWALESEIDYLITDFGNVLDALRREADPLPNASGVVIAAARPSLDGDAVDGEHVVLANTSDRAVDVSGFRIRDAAHRVLRVGDGYVLEPNASLRVYTGPGADAADRCHNHLDSAVLSPGGASLALWDVDRRLLDLYAY